MPSTIYGGDKQYVKQIQYSSMMSQCIIRVIIFIAHFKTLLAKCVI